MILVIAGHLGWKETTWYLDFKTTLYNFHMPFFLFLSGLLLAHTNYHYSNLKAYQSFISSKALKFFIPYVFFYSLFIAVNIFLGNIRSTEEIRQAITAMFLFPKSGSAGYLWYVYVLTEYYIFFPLLYQIKFIRSNTWIFILFGIIIWLFLPYYQLFEIRNFAQYFIFFSIGFVFQEYYDGLLRHLKKFGSLFLILFLLALILDMNQWYTFNMLELGLLSIPAILFLSLFLSQIKWLQYVGQNSFTLYLWDSVFIFAAIFISNALGYNNFNYLVPFYFLAGISGPLLLKYLLRKYRKSIVIRAIIP